MHWARSCAGFLALMLPIKAKIGDNPSQRKIRIRYHTELLYHPTTEQVDFSGADTSRMNLRGHRITGKPNFSNVNCILTEIRKKNSLNFFESLTSLLPAYPPAPPIMPNRIRNPPGGRGNQCLRFLGTGGKAAKGPDRPGDNISNIPSQSPAQKKEKKKQKRPTT